MSEPLTTKEHVEEQDQAVPVPPSADKAEKDTNNAPSWLPETVRNALSGFSHKLKAARTGAIMATPAIMVNNSSNILGLSHVASEMMMFKSGMKGAKLIDDPSKPWNWIAQPAKKIGADLWGGFKLRNFSLRQNPFKNFTDTHAATLNELEAQLASNRALAAAGKATKPIALGNPWQTRTTGVGFLVFTLMSLIPEKKESDEEIERMAKMRVLHPLGYVSERLKQAVWAPGWFNGNKREMMGLGYLSIGTISMLGSWRNRGKLIPTIAEDAKLIAKGLDQGYKFNPWYFATAVVSFIQGLPLLFALDERKAYGTYGALTVLRTVPLVRSIQEKLKRQEVGAGYYFASKVSFQLEDLAFMLIGGAQKVKNADGSYTIIDHEKLKEEAIKEAKKEKTKIKAEKSHHKVPTEEHAQDAMADTPTTTLAKVEHREAAMPERIAAHQAVQETQPALMAQ